MQNFFIAITMLVLSLNLTFCSKVPAIIVFGDSTVDTGNNNALPTLLKSNFEPYGRDFIGGKPTGRFGNGRLAPDFVSEAFGLGPFVPAYLDPEHSMRDFVTRVCFASAGTGLDNATSNVFSAIPFWKELEYFKEYQGKLRQYIGNEKAKQTLNKALYIISIGTNDFLENYFSLATTRKAQFTVDQYEDYLISILKKFVRDIYQLGARIVSISGMAPIGCLPLERAINILHGSSCNEEYNKVARDYNWKLVSMINELNGNLPGVKIVFNAVYDEMIDMIQNPSMYGFENVDSGCCGTGKLEMSYLCNQLNPITCNNANKYVFWDAFHPTEKVHKITVMHSLNTTLADLK